MAVALLTNQAMFDNISLVKIEARCMPLFFRFYCLLAPPRFYCREQSVTTFSLLIVYEN